MNNDLLTIGTTIAAGLMAIAAFLPKLIASFRKDSLDGKIAITHTSQVSGIQLSYEKQLTSLIERVTTMERRMAEMEATIHNQSVKVTRLIVVVIHMKGLLTTHAVPIPSHINTEIELLTSPEDLSRANET